MHFPAWYLGMYPDKRIILCSYGAELAESFSRRARGLLETHGLELFGVEVDERSRAMERWDIKGHYGGMVAAGVGGPITGKGANVLIVDDPVKNWEEAMSQIMRDALWDWFRTTARTRLEPDGSICIIMTRWHEDDLVGRLKRQGGEEWQEIRLPALAEDNDPMGRRPGEPLWPERYDAEALEQTRRDLGIWFWGMYQQDPRPPEGTLFQRDWLRYFRIEPREDGGADYVLANPSGVAKRWGREHCYVVQSVDLAASQKEMADYFVLTTAAITPDADVLVLDVDRRHVEGPDQPDIIVASARKNRPQAVVIEVIAYQLVLSQALTRSGLPVVPFRPDRDKYSRALVAASRYRQGTVYHLEGAHWLTDFENELLAFPLGEYDDQVDTISAIAQELPFYTPQPPPPEESERDRRIREKLEALERGKRHHSILGEV